MLGASTTRKRVAIAGTAVGLAALACCTIIAMRGRQKPSTPESRPAEPEQTASTSSGGSSRSDSGYGSSGSSSPSPSPSPPLPRTIVYSPVAYKNSGLSGYGLAKGEEFMRQQLENSSVYDVAGDGHCGFYSLWVCLYPYLKSPQNPVHNRFFARGGYEGLQAAVDKHAPQPFDPAKTLEDLEQQLAADSAPDVREFMRQHSVSAVRCLRAFMLKHALADPEYAKVLLQGAGKEHADAYNNRRKAVDTGNDTVEVFNQNIRDYVERIYLARYLKPGPAAGETWLSNESLVIVARELGVIIHMLETSASVVYHYHPQRASEDGPWLIDVESPRAGGHRARLDDPNYPHIYPILRGKAHFNAISDQREHVQ
ncbi:hypothetical protein PAPHI01_2395 [Pancytospora philotis]|nr:hypothetical protein PAPHI01_2395 [Pancytospora philotis]